MNKLTPIVVEKAELLRQITKQHNNGAAMARAAGFEPKHLARDLALLERSGLIEPRTAGGWPTLTANAVEQLSALERAETLGNVGPTVPYSLLVPDPDQPRKTFDEFELNGLAHSIDSRGLLQPLLVRPADPKTGEHVIVAGERRWRAIGRLIEWTESGINHGRGWTADQPVAVTLFDGEERDRRLAAIIENEQRAEVPHLERGAAYDALERGGMAPSEIAEAIGKSKRTIQEHIKVYREADPTLKAAFERGDADWTTLRESVKAPTLTPKLRLALVELADACNRFGNEYGRTKYRSDVGGPLPDLHRMGFADMTYAGSDGVGWASLTPAGKSQLAADEQYPEGEGRDKILFDVRVAVLGSGPSIDLSARDSYASRFLAFPKPLPAAQQSAGGEDDEDVPLPFGDSYNRAVIDSLASRTETQASVLLAKPATGDGDQDLTPNSISGRIAGRELTSRELIALVELAYKIESDGFEAEGVHMAAVQRYWTSATATALSQELRLIIWKHSPDRPPMAAITEKGLAFLEQHGAPKPRGSGASDRVVVTYDYLQAKYRNAGRERPEEGFLTPWLNIETTPALEIAPELDIAAASEIDDADAAADEALDVTRALVDIVCQAFDAGEALGTTIISALDRVAGAIERPLPWRASADADEAGIAFAANGEVAFVCDPNGDLPAALAQAQALFVVTMVNAGSGRRPQANPTELSAGETAHAELTEASDHA